MASQRWQTLKALYDITGGFPDLPGVHQQVSDTFLADSNRYIEFGRRLPSSMAFFVSDGPEGG